MATRYERFFNDNRLLEAESKRASTLHDVLTGVIAGVHEKPLEPSFLDILMNLTSEYDR